MNSSRSAFLRGINDIIPAVIGSIPFGMITGATAAAAGMDFWLAIGMSMIIYAGASQLAAISLLIQHAPAPIVVATVLIVNLRFMMYSAVIAPQFRHLSNAKKWLCSYLLVDHAFALVNSRFPANGAEKNPHPHVDAYYLGACSFMWLMWQISTAIGFFAGSKIPSSWSLDFAIPLAFLALVLPALQTRIHCVVALIAATAAGFTTAMPLKLGLMTAALAGVAVGAWLDKRAAKKIIPA